MRAKFMYMGMVVLTVAVIAWAQRREGSEGSSATSTTSGMFKVTPWPDHTAAGNSYAEEVEQHLNRMAADGWKFHSDMVGQNAKMMVFERTGR